MIRENQKFLNNTLVLVDIIIIVISLMLSYFIRFIILDTSQIRLSFNEYLRPLIVIIPIYFILYNIFELYVPYRKRSMDSEISGIIKANLIGLFILMSILFIIKFIHYSRYVLILFSIINTILCGLERYMLRKSLRKFRSKGYNLKHILIIGAGELACEFANKIYQNRHLGYSILGFIDDEKKKGYRIGGATVIGTLDDLPKIVLTKSIDEIIIALPLKEYDKLGQTIKNCEKYGIKSQIIPDYYKYIPAKPYMDQLDDIPLINIRHVPLDSPVNKLTKRIIDIILSLIGILITSPVLVFTAIMIKLTSPGSLIFNQVRVGLNRRNFNMYKFRSMKVQKDQEEKVKWTTKNDPRKTKFGDFIRRTSIDELPQLFNVLKGNMSLIGPRPERPYFVEKFREEIPKYMIKHHVRPGITGWAQVNGWRGDTSIKMRIEHDIYYIENWSLWLDVKIIFLTIFKGFVNKNAY